MSLAISTGASATIRTVDQLQNAILEALQSQSVVTVDASEVEEADLSFVQLMEAARRHAGADGKDIRLAQPANAHVRALLSRAGLLSDASPEDLDFWFHGEIPQ